MTSEELTTGGLRGTDESRAALAASSKVFNAGQRRFVDLFGDVDALFAVGDTTCNTEEKRQGAAAAALRAKEAPPEAPLRAGVGGAGGLSAQALAALSVAELRMRCSAAGVDTATFVEKRQFVDALAAPADAGGDGAGAGASGGNAAEGASGLSKAAKKRARKKRAKAKAQQLQQEEGAGAEDEVVPALGAASIGADGAGASS